MATAETKLMTAEEFYDFANHPDNRDRTLELEKGEVVELSRPGKLHGFVCGNVARILGNFAFQRKKGYVCTNDTGVVVERDPDTVRGSDILFFEDAQSLDQIGRKFAETPPRLTVEVLSANDRLGNLNRRIRDQIRFGTPLVWVVDPETRTVTVYQPGSGRHIEQYTLEEHEELTGDDVLSDFHCQIAEIFALPGQ